MVDLPLKYNLVYTSNKIPQITGIDWQTANKIRYIVPYKNAEGKVFITTTYTDYLKRVKGK